MFFSKNKRCFVCQKNQEEVCCDQCFLELPVLQGRRCEQCAGFLETFYPQKVCVRCLSEPPDFEKIFCYFAYEGIIQQIILRAKSHAPSQVYNILVWILWKTIQPVFSLFPTDLRLLPMPMHHRRLSFRGFHPTLEIARAFIKKMPWVLDVHSVIRVRHRPPQKGLDYVKRSNNVKNVFKASASIPEEQTWLILDDVATSTATLRSVSHVIQSAARPRKVYAVVCARTENQRESTDRS